jgi:hypothetical protein
MFPFGMLSSPPFQDYMAIGGSGNSSVDSPTDSTAVLRYDSDGGVRKTTTQGSSTTTEDIGEWSPLHPSESGGAGWHVRVTHSSGSDPYVSGSGLGVWLALSSSRNWTFSRTSDTPGTTNGSYLVEISDDGGSSVYDSASWSVSLFVDTP